MPNCDLCGTPVEVVGRTPLHYEPVTWRPIETAPKDGTWFIAWDNVSNILLFTVHWDAYTLEFLTENELWSGSLSHWMPLPEPPKHKEGRGDVKA